LIGAAILWEVIRLEDFPEHSETLEEKTKSVTGTSFSELRLISIVYRNSCAVDYLSDALEMGYHAAIFELGLAHRNLSMWYGEQGGLELYNEIRSLSESG
jgi:hypothetical protein